MNLLDDWTYAVCKALDLDDVDTGPVLPLARDVAHGVLRPAAPLTAYLLGIAVGRGADPATASATIAELIARWPR